MSKNCVERIIACVKVEARRLTRFSVSPVILHLYYRGARRIHQSVHLVGFSRTSQMFC